MNRGRCRKVKFGGQPGIRVVVADEMTESREGEVIGEDSKPVGIDKVIYPRALIRGSGLVVVKEERPLRPLEEQNLMMAQVPPADHGLPVAGNAIYEVPGAVSGCRDGGDSRCQFGSIVE